MLLLETSDLRSRRSRPSSAAAAPVEEKTAFDIILTDLSGNKVDVIIKAFPKLAWHCPPQYFACMSGITFMVNDRGEPTAAVIDLRRHGKLWEDFYDVALAKSRAAETREPIETVKRRLNWAGKIVAC